MSETQRPIILVDDDPDFLAINRRVLEARGYRVLCFTDCVTAWEAMEREPPGVVVTDLMMNALDSGFSFARKIKEDPRLQDTPVVIVTAVSSRLGFDFVPRSGEELRAMNADGFFPKPLAPDLLVAKVEELLR